MITATPDSLISVAGGFGNYGGGGGSGGWIYGIINRKGASFDGNQSLGWNGVFNLSAGLNHNRFVSTPLRKSQKSGADHTGSMGHERCPPGFEGVFCSPCVMGFYQKETTFDNCRPCENKPALNSIYLFNPGQHKSAECEYTCFTSVPNRNKNPNCYDSFTWFIERIGGWIVVTVILSFIGVCIFFLWLYIRVKAIKREKNKTKYSFNNLELNDKRKILEDDEFTTADLPFQMCREYFRGTNMIGNQWTIPLEPPQKLKNYIYNTGYEEFTTQLNNCARWKKKERYCYYLIAILFPPFLPLWTTKKRRSKFKKLRTLAHELHKGIWLNNSEKRRANLVAKTIKISASCDFTMAYMDFLDIEKDREFYNGPTLPLTFHLSGDGGFNSPLNLSYRDCLVRSLSLLDRTENFIEIYIENLNSHLKALSFFEYLSFSEAKFWELIKYLHSNNEGILKKRSIKAELAILEYKNNGNLTVKKERSAITDPKNSSQTYIFHFDFISKHPQTVSHIVEYCRYEMFTKRTDIKLAIVFSRLDQSTIISMNTNYDIQAVSPQKAESQSLLTINGYNNSTRISDGTSPKFYQSRDKDEESSSDDSDSDGYDQMFSGLKSKWSEPMILKGNDKSSKSINKESFSASGSAYSQASYCPNKVEVEDYEGNEELANMLNNDNPLNDFKNRRHSRGCCFNFKISLLAFLKLAFLRSSLPPKYPMLNLSLMIVLLFLDVSAGMMIFLLYEQQEEFQISLIPFGFIYPLTILISPLVALASIFVCKSSFYRIFMNLNALTCCTNIFLTLLMELTLAFFVTSGADGQITRTQTIEPILLLIAKIVIKILMAYFACKQLAFNDNHAFYSNRDVLENIHKTVTKENTRDYVSEMFKREITDD